MTTEAYKPQEGALPWKVIEFFTTNPDERLTVHQISARFDTPSLNIHTKLAPAIAAGALRRRENEDGELEYSLGKGVPAIKANHARNPTLGAGTGVGQAIAAPASPAAAKRKVRKCAVDFDTLKIEKGVPIVPARGNRKDQYRAYLAKLEVGDSFVMPKSARSTFTSASAELKNAGKGTFRYSAVNEREIRCWRIT